MLFLRSISLTQFKNYPSVKFDFTGRITCICGLNGVGKTNLLDAISYTCLTKSYFSRTDAQNVLHGAAGFRIEARFDVNGQEVNVVCILRENGRKEFLWQGEPYERFANHIGRLPCVIIAPDDIQIITEGSEERRRFLDTLLCQLDAQYLQQLMDYNKVLQQRNSFLKSLYDQVTPDMRLLDVYDEQLTAYGQQVYEVRHHFLQSFMPQVQNWYTRIAGSKEQVNLQYESQLTGSSFAEILSGSREKDRVLQRTNAGIHRDDLVIRFNGQPFKSTASQGQRKSLLFALKLSEFETLRKEKGFPPLLLLDDVFEKLDEGRMRNLLDQVCLENNGQVFITDTHEERIRQHFEEMKIEWQLISL